MANYGTPFYSEKAAEDIFKPGSVTIATATTLEQLVGVATVTEPTGAVKETQEKLSLTLNQGPTAEVACEIGFTLNMGNFQSTKMLVSLKAPSNIDPDSLDKTYEYIKNWVDKKLTALVEEAKKTLE
jgi:hypothetical protein